MKKREAYYLGLDIGTDSVGYAVTNQNYDLLKFKGEPMWGTHLFEGGQDAADRRIHRTSRRRIDRRQQRVSLINELFAEEIIKTDPHFFQRRKESSLYGDDSHYGVRIFSADTGLSDREYHEKYPTIHHLILELMTSNEPHDVRLVYIACAWLVAHRGHFLFDIAPDRMDKLLDFDAVYSDFCQYLLDQNCTLPWESSATADDILNILKMDIGVTRKKDAFKNRI
jgi:CRISPR-associated endonuclease Csn1